MKNKLFENLFIFEMANNHQGDLALGMTIIDEMARVKRTHQIRAAVKLQYRDLKTFIHPAAAARADVKHVSRFLSTALSFDDMVRMVRAIKDQDLLAMVTPFDEVSVQKCLEHGVDILKVASCSAQDWPLLELVAKAGRPVIISTGGLNLSQIDKVVSFFTHHACDFGLMHCVAVYPTPPEHVQLNFVARLARRFPAIPVGYSGHEPPGDLDTIKLAVAKGAVMFERHVGVPTDSVKLNAYSMNPDEAGAWVAAAHKAVAICGPKDGKEITQDEIDSLLSLMRGTYVRRTIAKGERINREDVYFAMPCEAGQTTSGQFGQYRAEFHASRDYQPDEALRERAAEDEISRIRSIIHDVRGFLYEAQIFLGPDVQIELSHHYGIDQFRRVGVTMITVINREYCKKLMVMLPGQRHPRHMHKLKEETFQLLYGDVTVNLEGREIVLSPGETLLVERSAMHSFHSEGGAVVEEISSTHHRNDSYYEDEAVASMDPMQRKTILHDW
jgi:sialic acid synthase SpsE/quercetin dioxygenase-like cupin family protein